MRHKLRRSISSDKYSNITHMTKHYYNSLIKRKRREKELFYFLLKNKSFKIYIFISSILITFFICFCFDMLFNSNNSMAKGDKNNTENSSEQMSDIDSPFYFNNNFSCLENLAYITNRFKACKVFKNQGERDIYERFSFGSRAFELNTVPLLNSDLTLSKNNKICVRGGDIISAIYNKNDINHIKCVDFQGLKYNKGSVYDLRFSISIVKLNEVHNSSPINIYDFDNYKLKKAPNVLFYGQNNENIRICNISKITYNFSQKDHELPVIDLKWKSKTEMMCIKNVLLIKE